MTVIPFFGRIGNKTRILNKIIPNFPKHNTYVEPFIGSGSILFNKEKSKKEIINDLDKNLIEGYELLKNSPSKEKLLELAVKPNGKTKEMKIKQIQEFIDSPDNTKEHLLLKKMYMSKNTFCNIGSGKIFRDYTNIDKIKNIEVYIERLKEVSILNKDYKAVINKYDDKDTFFYLDPPYENSENIYKFGNINLEEMKELLKTIKGKFMLSLNDSENIRKIFKDFKINVFNVKRVGGKHVGAKDRNEVLITNYKI